MVLDKKTEIIAKYDQKIQLANEGTNRIIGIRWLGFHVFTRELTNGLDVNVVIEIVDRSQNYNIVLISVRKCGLFV